MGLLQLRRELGLSVGDVQIKPIDRTPCVAAGINPHGWDIELQINPSFEFAKDRAVRAFCRLKKLQSAAESECSDVLVHECGHRELPNGIGCPGDLESHVKYFLEPIGRELKRQGKQPQKELEKDSMVGYFANLATDFINNTNCRSVTDMSGQVLFWYEQGKSSENEKYTKLYEAFVKLNLHVWGDKAGRSFLNGFFTNDKKVEKAVSAVIAELDLKKDLESQEFLTDRENWGRIATVMTKHLAPLFDESEQLFELFGGDAVGGEKPEKEGLVLGYYKAGKGKPSFIEDYESLKSLYFALAREIRIIAPALYKTHSLPFAPMKHRVFDPEADDPVTISRKILLGADARPALAVPASHLTLPYEVKHGLQSFPPISVCVIDTSGSMKEGAEDKNNPGNKAFIPWGNKSKYHYALLGFFGIVNYLSRENILAKVNVNSANFSNETKVGVGLQDAIRNLLRPQFGGTTIDMNEMRRLIKKGSLAFTLTDGEVANWDSIEQEFIELTSRAYFFHLQIGEPSEMSKALERAGLPVIPCKGNQDLAGLMVDLTSKTYSTVVRNV